MAMTNDEWTAARIAAGVPVFCPSCGGEGTVGGLVVGNRVIDETCGRCHGHGILKGEQHHVAE